MVDLSWFPYSVTATILFGIAMAFYKLPYARNINRFATTFWLLFISLILSLIFFNKYLIFTNTLTILFGLLWGASFTGLVLLQMYALSHVETNTLFPITTIASLLITILIAVFYFGDKLSYLQLIGLILIIFTISFFLYKKGRLQYPRYVILIGFIIIFISAFNKILQKFAADWVNIQAFQVFQYIFASIISLLILIISNRKELYKNLVSKSFKVGSLIGIFSFFGGYLYLIALTKGPFSLITSIHSSYIFITALTGLVLFKEELTIKKVLLIILAIIATLLIRSG